MALERTDPEPPVAPARVDVTPAALEPLDGPAGPPVAVSAVGPAPAFASMAGGEATEPVVCPRCGTPGLVDLARRDAAGFCSRCDYPLFWAVRQSAHGGAEAGDDARRRLPGTVGAQTIASLPCPHCAEPNPPRAAVCLRCGRPMVVVPEPLPVAVVAPPPPAPAPPAPVPWVAPWWLILFVVGLIVLTGLSLVALLG
ncbi:hypothetical protein [Jiangella mangrovi]|uniref:Uncharacterized protein n=1 Tax=Jiangella mangrovi TaxID=1524084 RepID=A0A7W9LN11_9ACTN|nr:hypothetical protein [Jiangella mangrovi]MBB5789821.1 hypothetical protein [Jiangella mangrovi]